MICLAFIVGGVVFTMKPLLLEQGWALVGLTLAVVTCHNFAGYLLGYGVGMLYRFPVAKKRTLSIAWQRCSRATSSPIRPCWR